VITYLLAFKQEIQLHIRLDNLVNRVCVGFERKPFVVVYVKVIYVVQVKLTCSWRRYFGDCIFSEDRLRLEPV
jgi:hypothetical protein